MGTIDDERAALTDQRIRLFGPGRFLPDGRHDRRSLFGLVVPEVSRIEFTYADGSPSVSEDHLAGAFGIVIDANRRPSAVTGYDTAGKVVGHLDMSSRYMDFRYCPGGTSGCPGWPD